MVAKVVGELNADGVRWELERVVRWLSGVGYHAHEASTWQ